MQLDHTAALVAPSPGKVKTSMPPAACGHYRPNVFAVPAQLSLG
jgi:hypothetical protein